MGHCIGALGQVHNHPLKRMLMFYIEQVRSPQPLPALSKQVSTAPAKSPTVSSCATCRKCWNLWPFGATGVTPTFPYIPIRTETNRLVVVLDAFFSLNNVYSRILQSRASHEFCRVRRALFNVMIWSSFFILFNSFYPCLQTNGLCIKFLIANRTDKEPCHKVCCFQSQLCTLNICQSDPDSAKISSTLGQHGKQESE